MAGNLCKAYFAEYHVSASLSETKSNQLRYTDCIYSSRRRCPSIRTRHADVSCPDHRRLRNCGPILRLPDGRLTHRAGMCLSDIP